MITAEALIDLNAIKLNYQQLSQQNNHQPLIAVIKGDAYGHGAIKIAKALPNANKFAVARLEEALQLRHSGINQPILLLEGCFNGQDLQLASQFQLDTTIHHHQQLIDLENYPLVNPVTVWVKVDTGMHRLGFSPYEISDVVARIRRTNKIKGEVCFISHFSNADEPDNPKTEQQIASFTRATQSYAGNKSIANSAGLLFWPHAHMDIARTGIALYGISPSAEHIGTDHNLTPVMTLTSRLIAIRKHAANEPVGYGEAWRSPTDTHIGVIAFGYGDGYPRLVPTNTPVYINGRTVPIVGRVSMDMMTVDLGSAHQDKVGDTVELWGQHLPIEHVAKNLGTIPYELTIKLTSRVHQRFIPEE
ncbi:alanine racemase [Photobacterium sp. DNB23_23_1]